MFIGRRPLLGAAIVGGTAYYAGKKRVASQQREEGEQYQIQQLQDQNAQMQQQLNAQQAAAPVAPGPAGDEDPMAKLGQLKTLLDQGVLTQAEFDAQKTKILQSM
jgi:membrane protease subunit (stomatin/prohibitin family)